MFRVSLANAFAKRTCKPLYEKHQATPFAGTLASTESAIFSGMVASFNTDGEFVACDGSTTAPEGNPIGLFALDHNTTIDDLDGQPTDLAPFAVWMGGPDALFKVSGSAIEATGTFAVGTLLYAGDGNPAAIGQLTDANSGSDVPVGRVVEVGASNAYLVVQLSLPSSVEVA